ncbi:hypothetical protein GWE18_12295 [Bradyrhizobium sp. CSA112]|uniref:hypothetical protein n=1 Tax=Bradyrhizobium sp. CSA112 TaxID=2699170 RepID=UPI0023B07EB6|nr:hypothetical protein [Bradyrhizobium sp. CSA112]MDE5453630.1 hypothetical protein [Bradyrhizobium sp. CSA112]
MKRLTDNDFTNLNNQRQVGIVLERLGFVGSGKHNSTTTSLRTPFVFDNFEIQVDDTPVRLAPPHVSSRARIWSFWQMDRPVARSDAPVKTDIQEI